jgi:uncharacterized protein YhbP (UPF0306 family)
MLTRSEIPSDLLDLSSMTLATVGLDGIAHAATVFVAFDRNLNGFFFSENHTRHSRDIRENPRVAVSIYPQCQDWREIRGLQMHGQVSPVKQGTDWESGWKLYSQKFPFVANLKAIVLKNSLYVFTPNWIRLVDNRLGFGYKKEWTIKS